jgi:putative transposase
MKKRHSPEQIVRKLRQADEKVASGASVPNIARELGVSEATFHRWRNRYGRQDESRRDGASQGARKGECPSEEAGGRSSPGNPDPKGGELKNV